MYKRFLVALPLHYDVHISNDHENHLNALFMQCVQFLFYSAKKNKKKAFFFKGKSINMLTICFYKKKCYVFFVEEWHTLGGALNLDIHQTEKI